MTPISSKKKMTTKTDGGKKLSGDDELKAGIVLGLEKNVELGLMTVKTVNGKKSYSLTQKGIDYVERMPL